MFQRSTNQHFIRRSRKMCFSEAKSVLVTVLIFHQRTASWSVPEEKRDIYVAAKVQNIFSFMEGREHL